MPNAEGVEANARRCSACRAHRASPQVRLAAADRNLAARVLLTHGSAPKSPLHPCKGLEQAPYSQPEKSA
jgi:hypothetical protein